MASRIRTVKPEFYRHEELYKLEKETGWPMRIAFSGLFTIADRDGRFKWKPNNIKLDVLPWDEVDFERVLDALASRGFIEKYEKNGEFFGWIPKFSTHQVINNKEKASELPDPKDSNILSTREARVTDAIVTPLFLDQGEGKGKERKGTGRERESRESRVDDTSATPSVQKNKTQFLISRYCELWKDRYKENPPIVGKDAGIAGRLAKSLSQEKIETYLDAFFAMPEPWLVKAKHPLELFESKLKEIAVFAGSGKFTTRTEVQQADRGTAQLSQIERIRRGEL